jgi:glycosyltransferase involved in cell wall biosynthesis
MEYSKSNNRVHFSVVLATHNEAANIKTCIASVADMADEIIVVDGESTDKTADIAQSLGAKVIRTTNKPMFHTNKQMAMDAATGDWILQLDADEVVDDELKQFIKKILREDSTFSAFWLKRKNWFLGTFLKKGGQYPDPVIRLYKKGKAYLPQKDVHEQMEVDGAIGWADGHLLHYNAPDFSRYITNANRYTSQTARQLKEQGVRLNVVNDLRYLIWKPKMTFFRLFFRHKGFVDGFPGFVFALFSGLHHALAYMKLGDLYRNETKH